MKYPPLKEVISRSKQIKSYLLKKLKEKRNSELELTLINSIESFTNHTKSKMSFYGYNDFANTGDQALWLSLVYFYKRNFGMNKVKYLESYSKTRFKDIGERADIVIFPGGGSLGNRYNSSLDRVNLLKSNKNLRAIQMPVSTTFIKNEDTLYELRKEYSVDNRVLTFCRDETSKGEAESKLQIKPILTVDLVEFLPDLSDFKTGELDHLYLFRTDSESAVNFNKLNIKRDQTTDWKEISKYESKLQTISKIRRKIISYKKSNLEFFGNTNLYRNQNLKLSLEISAHATSNALAYLSFYNEITTDRLHGLLLSNKMGLNINYVDNDHGKISRYLNTWGNRHKNVNKLV